MLIILPSPIPKLQHALLPLQSVVNQGACIDSLFFLCFQFGLTFESFKELGVHHKPCTGHGSGPNIICNYNIKFNLLCNNKTHDSFLPFATKHFFSQREWMV